MVVFGCGNPCPTGSFGAGVPGGNFGQNNSVFGSDSFGVGDPSGFGISQFPLFGAAASNNTRYNTWATSHPALFPARPAFRFGQASTAMPRYDPHPVLSPARGFAGSTTQAPAWTGIFQETGHSTFGAPKQVFGTSSAYGAPKPIFGSSQPYTAPSASGFEFGGPPRAFTFGVPSGTEHFGQQFQMPNSCNQQPNVKVPNTTFDQIRIQLPKEPSAGAVSNGTTVRFIPVVGNDIVLKNGSSAAIIIRHNSITIMKEYESKSFEELRMEDYVVNRKGIQDVTMEPPLIVTKPSATLSQESTKAPTGLGKEKGEIAVTIGQEKDAVTCLFSHPATLSQDNVPATASENEKGQSQIFRMPIPKTFRPPPNSYVFSGNSSLTFKFPKETGEASESLPDKAAQNSDDPVSAQPSESLSFGTKDATELPSVMSLITGMMSEIQQINASIVNLNTDKKLELVKNENETLKNSVSTLKDKLGQMESLLTVYYVDIVGVPEIKGENIREIVEKVAVALGCPLGQHDIDMCHRCGDPTPMPRKIVVKFLRQQTRESFLGLAANKYLYTNGIGICDQKLSIVICKHNFD